MTDYTYQEIDYAIQREDGKPFTPEQLADLNTIPDLLVAWVEARGMVLIGGARPLTAEEANAE